MAYQHQFSSQKELPKGSHFNHKHSLEMVRSMIHQPTITQYSTPPARIPRISEFLSQDHPPDQKIEHFTQGDQNKPMILTSKKSRKYSDAMFNQELIQNINRSKLFDSKIMEPLKFGFGEREKMKSPKTQEQTNKTAFKVRETCNQTPPHLDLVTANRSHLTFNPLKMQKRQFASPKFNFKDSPKKQHQQGQKKSINDYVNVITQEPIKDSEQRSSPTLTKYKSSLIKPAKDFLMFRSYVEGENLGAKSHNQTPMLLTPPQDGQLKKIQTFNSSNMKNFFKKFSVEDRHEPYSPLKKAKEVETSSSDLTPTQSLRSSINRLSKDDFYMGKRLGKGKFGEVFLAKHKQIGFLCAMKIISKTTIVSEKIEGQLISQIKIQKYLNHPNIVALYKMFSDKQNFYLLQEPCLEGHLYQKMKKMKKIAQKEAAAIVKQICQAVGYLHSQKIIHRDIKPENILLSEGLVKICDFGWAAYHNDKFRDTFCGTPLYLSPQLLNQSNYDDKVDNWAIGILTYEMLYGKIPFKITTKQELQKILFQQIVFPQNVEVSQAAKDFILKMLERDPIKRGQIESCMSHAFFSGV